MQRLQQAVVNRRIAISEQDIEDLLDSPYYQELLSDEFRVGHILLAMEPNASQETIKAAEDAAVEIVKELRAGADFAEMAISRSAGSRALEGGDLGWRKAAELPTLFAEYVVQMEVGDVSPPIASGSGLHIVKLLEQRGAGTREAGAGAAEAHSGNAFGDPHAGTDRGADMGHPRPPSGRRGLCGAGGGVL